MADQKSIDRRRKLALALRQTSETGSQGSQAGRFYVAPSPFASIMSGLASVGSGYMGGKADREQETFDEDQKSQLAEALRAMTGGPTESLVSKQDRPSGSAPPMKGPINTDPAEYKIPTIDRAGFGIDMSRPMLNNDDGSFSTERTIGVNLDGREYNIPTIVGGKQVSNEEAIANARQALQRGETFPNFATVPEAEAAAKARSQQIGALRGPSSQPPAADPRQDAALAVLRNLPLEQQRAIIAQQAAGRLFPKEPEPYTLAPGATRFGGNNKPIAQSPNKPSVATPFERQLESAGFVPGTPEYQEQLKKYLERQTTHAPAPATNVTLNTEKNLYGTMADAQGKENVNLFQQAQKAPELLGRAQRVKQLLSEGDVITGAGADWLLTGAKVANQFGFNTGDAAADTEALGRDLAAATLDQIKSSGLGAGSGFSNADRDFLEKVVGGTITLEASTLKRLAELNEKSALATIDRWNATASRLDPSQLKNLGMSQIAMPPGSAVPSAQPKLQKNPDGTYTYSP